MSDPTALPTDALLLCLTVFVLGLKHGLDADHLAAIDGLTRLQRREGRPLARWCGALFSLGHGAIVIGVALGVSLLQRHWQAPAWLEDTGSWISIALLLLLGVANLRALLGTAPGQPVAPVGLRSRWLAPLFERWLQAGGAWAVAGVGALFAVSFDTISQAALFALAASGFGAGAVPAAAALGALFVIGMLVTDALNGWWVARLLDRADRLALVASRVMGAGVALLSIAVAAFALSRKASGTLDGWADAQGLLFGLLALGLMAMSFMLAWLLAQGATPRRTPQPG